MGSDQRIRGHRLLGRFCYGACFGFGFVITTVTLTAMFWIVWCYFGLTAVPISESQRRAIVDYSFTTAASLPTLPPELPETSLNQISKFSTTSTNLDKRKDLYNGRAVNTPEINLRRQEQINRTLENNQAINMTERERRSSSSTNQENENIRKIILNYDEDRKLDPEQRTNFETNGMFIKNEKDIGKEHEIRRLPIGDQFNGSLDESQIEYNESSKLDHLRNNPLQLNNRNIYDDKSLHNVTYSNRPIKNENDRKDDIFIKDESYSGGTSFRDDAKNDKTDDIASKDRTEEQTFDGTRYSNRRQYTDTRDNERAARENTKLPERNDGRNYETRPGYMRPDFNSPREERFERRRLEYDQERSFETKIRDDRRIPENTHSREDRFEKRRTEYGRDDDEYYERRRTNDNNRPASYDRDFREDRYADRVPYSSERRRFPEDRRTEDHFYDDKQYEEQRYRNRRINEEGVYQDRRVYDDERRRRIYPEDQYRDESITDRDRYLKDDRNRNREFIRSETDQRTNTGRYQTRNKEYFDEEGKFYERREETLPILDRERSYSTRYDERLIDDPRKRTMTRDPIISSKSGYDRSFDSTQPRREVYNTRYESRNNFYGNNDKDYPQTNREDRFTETRKPLLVEDRYRSEYRNDRPPPYIDRDRISPTRVIDTPYTPSAFNDEINSPQRRYQDSFNRDNIPISRDRRYDNDRDKTSTIIDSSRSSGDERRYYRERPLQGGEGIEVTLDRRSYSSEDKEFEKTGRTRPTYVRDKDYDYDIGKRRYSSNEARRYYDEYDDYRDDRRSSYDSVNNERKDIRDRPDRNDRNSNRDTRHRYYNQENSDAYNKNPNTDSRNDQNRDRYDDSKFDDHYDRKNLDSISTIDTASRGTNFETTIKRQEESTSPLYDHKNDKRFQGNQNLPNNSTETNLRINTEEDRISLNPNTQLANLKPNTWQEKSPGQENISKDGRQTGTSTRIFDNDSDQRMSAKDVIEAALRHSETSDSITREVHYPVFDPRISNLTSSDIIRPSERRGTTINSKRRKK